MDKYAKVPSTLKNKPRWSAYELDDNYERGIFRIPLYQESWYEFPNEETRGTLEEALQEKGTRGKKPDGIGYVLDKNEYVIEIQDYILNKEKVEMVTDILTTFRSYFEGGIIEDSVLIFLRADADWINNAYYSKRLGNNIEIFGAGHFVPITGENVPGFIHYDNIADCTYILKSVLDKYMIVSKLHVSPQTQGEDSGAEKESDIYRKIEGVVEEIKPREPIAKFENIPKQMQILNRWVYDTAGVRTPEINDTYNLSRDEDGINKLLAFETAKKVIPNYSSNENYLSLKFVLLNEGIYCVMVPNAFVKGKNSSLTRKAKRIIELFDSYTEISKNRTKLFIWFKAQNYPWLTNIKSKHFDIYTVDYSIEMTGDVYDDYKDLKDCSEQTKQLYKEYCKDESMVEAIDAAFDDSTISTTTEPNKEDIVKAAKTTCFVEIKSLLTYPNHPFKPYTKEKLTELAESIKDNGLIQPIIVMKSESGDSYLILSGHNRVQAYKHLGIDMIEAIAYEFMPQEESDLIVVESNLKHREKLFPSEKAKAYKMQRDALKKQGKRTDLEPQEPDEMNAPETSSPGGIKLDSAKKIGEKYDKGRTTIYRYISLNDLIPELLELVDDEKITIKAGEVLSSLKENEQSVVQTYFFDVKKTNLDLKTATKIKELPEITYESIDRMLNNELEKDKAIRQIKIPVKLLGGMLDHLHDENERIDYIIKALEFYKKSVNQGQDTE